MIEPDDDTITATLTFEPGIEELQAGIEELIRSIVRDEISNHHMHTRPEAAQHD